jgi:hypothetical protein
MPLRTRDRFGAECVRQSVGREGERAQFPSTVLLLNCRSTSSTFSPSGESARPRSAANLLSSFNKERTPPRTRISGASEALDLPFSTNEWRSSSALRASEILCRTRVDPFWAHDADRAAQSGRW